jgi:tRNA threonylcarbamoyl adenosine modification protein (Sua5/YciO/YrdC/YwlC family)
MEGRMIVEWDPERPKKKTTTLIKESLENGAIIGYPTDTFYGLGCDLFNIKAIKTLHAMRGLSEKRALSLIFRDIKDISNYAILSDFAFHVLKSMLPGAYTFILKPKRIVPRLLMTGKKEVGVRIPNHPVPLGLTTLLGRPIINTTAKIVGQEALSDPRDIERYFKDQVSIVIDGGLIVGEPSTVVSLVDDKVNVLREGKGPLTDLLRS